MLLLAIIAIVVATFIGMSTNDWVGRILFGVIFFTVITLWPRKTTQR